MNEQDMSCTWMLLTIIAIVDQQWQILGNVELTSSDWISWTMVYLWKNCVNNASIFQAKKDPFKYQYILSTDKFKSKIGNIAKFSDSLKYLPFIFTDDNHYTCSLYHSKDHYNMAPKYIVTLSFDVLKLSRCLCKKIFFFPFLLRENDNFACSWQF